MKKRFTASLNGKRYKVIQTPLGHLWGAVEIEKKLISLDPEMNHRSDEAKAEILLHEALHVLAQKWTEKRVLRAGKDLARLLVTAGIIRNAKAKEGG
jgi:hypothetical protein